MSQNGNGAPARGREPFGQVAIRKGYVNPQQVHDALRNQAALKERGEKHKLIGMVMLEMGVLGTTELIDVLKELNLAYTQGAQPPATRRAART